MKYVLDCTLRDGGYVNNWSFGKGNIIKIAELLDESNIDIVEIGFLTNKKRDDASLFNSTKDINKLTIKKKNSLFAGMIAIGEHDVNLRQIQPQKKSLLDVIRITFHNNESEINKAIFYFKYLNKIGYKVCLQPVGSACLSDNEILKIIKIVNKLKPYAFYLVDTLGILNPISLNKKIAFIDNHLAKGIKIGFHSHNNLQLSFSNAISINAKRDIIIDSSLLGMGRGAGNLPTELIVNHLITNNNDKYKLNPILRVIDDYIKPLRLSYNWGYNSYYYISAINGCHPNYARYLLNRQTLPTEDVNKLLKSIPNKNKSIYSERIIRDLYFKYQVNFIDDSKDINKLKKELKGKNILILATGPSIIKYKKKLDLIIKRKRPIVIGVNKYVDLFENDYVFISNRKRLDSFTPIKDVKTICTSNLSKKSNYTFDYSNLIIRQEEGDNATILLMNLLNKLDVKKVYIAGFDGFDSNMSNHYDGSKTLLSLNEANRKNQNIKKILKTLKKDKKIEFLTPTKYL